jgi:hypothetical protein
MRVVDAVIEACFSGTPPLTRIWPDGLMQRRRSLLSIAAVGTPWLKLLPPVPEPIRSSVHRGPARRLSAAPMGALSVA